MAGTYLVPQGAQSPHHPVTAMSTFYHFMAFLTLSLSVSLATTSIVLSHLLHTRWQPSRRWTNDEWGKLSMFGVYLARNDFLRSTLMFHRHTCIQWVHQRCPEPIHWQQPTTCPWPATIDAIDCFLFGMPASMRPKVSSNSSTELPPIHSASIFFSRLRSDLFYQRMFPQRKASSQSLSCALISMSFCVALIGSTSQICSVHTRTPFLSYRCEVSMHDVNSSLGFSVCTAWYLFSWTSSFFSSLLFVLVFQIRSSIFRKNSPHRFRWSVR